MNFKESIVKFKKRVNQVEPMHSYQQDYPYFKPNPEYKPMNRNYVSYSQIRLPLYDVDYSKALCSESSQSFNLDTCYNGYQQ